MSAAQPALSTTAIDLARHDGDRERPRWRPVLVLALLLPLFGQSFHYVKYLAPLWLLSKTFPILSLPLALILIGGRRPVGARQVLSSTVWLVLVPTFAAVISFQQTFFVGLVAQLKLLPLLYFFSFLAVLRWVRPTLRELTIGFLICAAVTGVVLALIWLLAPQSWYAQQFVLGESPVMTNDDRGNRIRMPMYYGLIGIFYCYRRFVATRRPSWLLLAAFGFTLVVAAVRTRSMVLGVAGVGAIVAFAAAAPRVRLALAAIIPLAAVALFSVPYVASVFRTDSASGFDIRWITTVKAVGFLGTDPLRWIFGVGTISPLDPAGLMTYFNHFFFLADITWVGVVFEYGLIGALLILAIPLRGVMLLRAALARVRAGTRGGADASFLGALQDYLVYALLISELYPMTIAPGELVVILAIAVYTLEIEPTPARGRLASC